MSLRLAGGIVAVGVAAGAALHWYRHHRPSRRDLTTHDEQELDAAIMKAEQNGDLRPLTRWWRAFNRSGHAELLIAKDEIDAHRGRVRSNDGSPLYRAAVLDAPAAAAHLIALGDDVNYRHPSHGDGPLLHCAEQGHDEVLVQCLAAPGLEPRRACSIDVRRFLGQGTPLYDEGGLTPLALAARSGRLSTVRVILEHAAAREAWLHAPDSFGRGLVAATCEQLALGGSEWKRQQLTQIVHALCAAQGADAAAALRVAPPREQAEAAERRRQREVRARCLQRERAREAAARARGLAEVARAYRPRHPSVYELALSPPDVLDYGPGSAAAAEGAEGAEGAAAVWRGVREPVPGVLSFPLLSAELCQKAWEELHAYEAAAASNTELPLHVRHDGNLGSLETLGFLPLLKSIERAVAPVLAARLPAFGRCEVHPAFP